MAGVRGNGDLGDGGTSFASLRGRRGYPQRMPTIVSDSLHDLDEGDVDIWASCGGAEFVHPRDLISAYRWWDGSIPDGVDPALIAYWLRLSFLDLRRQNLDLLATVHKRMAVFDE